MARVAPWLVAASFFPVTAGAQPPAPPRDAPQQTGTAIIRGRVLVDGTDHALPRTQIRATSDKGRTYDANTDGDGLPSGDYLLIAVDHINPGEFSDPEFLERVRTKATRFSLTEGETKSIDLKLSSSS